MIQRRTEIVQFGIGPCIPTHLIGVIKVRLERLRLIGKKCEMPVARPLALIRSSELLAAVLAYRREHPIAWFGCLLIRHHQRLVDQASQKIEHVSGFHAVASANSFCGLQRPAAGEYRKAPQKNSLGIVEKVVTPVDRRAQRLLAWQRGAIAARAS